uniref:Uncharacterized protein n=1 Tax=viral metagenome TaxID=1070528 RepID=A0A6C0E2Y9_9ZZZZ
MSYVGKGKTEYPISLLAGYHHDYTRITTNDVNFMQYYFKIQKINRNIFKAHVRQINET